MFALTLMLGLLAANILRKEVSVNKIEVSVNKIKENVKPAEQKIGACQGTGNGVGVGQGSGECYPNSFQESEPASKNAIKILSKAQPKYTDAARQNNVQGEVKLRVTFLSNGEIGNISVVSGLPDGLTEQAIAAARQIRFDPPKRNGVPYSVTKIVQYTFTIY